MKTFGQHKFHVFNDLILNSHSRYIYNTKFVSSGFRMDRCPYEGFGGDPAIIFASLATNKISIANWLTIIVEQQRLRLYWDY